MSDAPAPDWPPAGWAIRSIRHGGHRHTYYVIDRVGPDSAGAVLLLHEFPGISRHLVALAERLGRDFQVVVPSLFGRDGSPSALRSVARLCVRREVTWLARNRSGPAVPWLLDLVGDVVAPLGRGRCGVIGLCMTGGFALATTVDRRVRAAVVGEPALPVANLGPLRLPAYGSRAANLGLSPDAVAAVRARVDDPADPLCLRGYRFRDDRLSPAERLDSVRALLGPERAHIVTLTEPDPAGHSTLTTAHANAEAIEDVVAFLRDRLAG